MKVVTREQAICMFFCKEYNKDDVKKFTKEVNGEICCTEDPTKPIILSKRTINQNPFVYHKYQPRESVLNEIKIEEQKSQVKNYLQDFCNFLTQSLFLLINTMMRCMKTVCAQWVISWLMFGSTHIYFKTKAPTGFGRKEIDSAVTISVRSLYVLKEKYIANVVRFIVEQLPLYQQTIQSFKNDGYNAIGYARKPKTKESDETRSNLLNIMYKKLKVRSMADKVFVSFNTNSNESIMDRDLADDNKLLEKLDADGYNRYVVFYAHL